MKILLLNQAFYPDVASTAQHLSDLAVELAARGHEVRVMCSRRIYDNPDVLHARREIWRSVKIRRIYSFGFGKSARWRRYADFGSYLMNCLRHLVTQPGFDLVIAMTSPPLISWLGALFVRLKRGKFVFWVMDLNPDEALAAGWMRPGSWATRRLQWMLQFSLNQADVIVTLDKFMAQRVQAKNVPPEKIAILPPWSHDHHVYYNVEGREQFRKEHQLEGKFVVMYSGNHSPCHPLTTLLEAARRLTAHPSISFCFVGGGTEFENVRAYKNQHDLTNVVMAQYQPLDKLSASLSSADMHVVVMGDPFVGIVHTCKVYNIRILGIPYLYIGPQVSHIAELQPNYSARHGDVDLVVNHVLQAAKLRLPRVAPVDIREHGQDYLIRKMITILETTLVHDGVAEPAKVVRPVALEYPTFIPARPNGTSQSLHASETDPAIIRKSAGAS